MATGFLTVRPVADTRRTRSRPAATRPQLADVTAAAPTPAAAAGGAVGTAYRLGYARVSTADQTPASQLDALNTAGCHEVFVDHASGTTTDRPALSRLLERLRPGDTLVVWRLDRLGRSTAHLIDTVTRLGERGIGFCSLTEALDTTTPAGRLLFGIMAALAAFERDLVVERTNAGLAAARARGRVGGRPPTMTPHKLAVARQLLAAGQSKTLVAATIGVSRPTLYEHLNRSPR